MATLQLLQLTERGRGALSSRRKALLFAMGIAVAGGTAICLQSRFNFKRRDCHHQCNGVEDDTRTVDLVQGDLVNKKEKKKRGLKSLQVLTSILISHMGHVDARDLLTLGSIVVLKTAFGNRLARVQGFLFRAAFLRRVSVFSRLIFENLLLCFIQSALHSSAKYVTGTLSLRFRNILTKVIHEHYFENMAYYKVSHVGGRVTNPEQRIASDVPKFSSELSDLVQLDLAAITDGLLYTWRLCSYTSPKYFFWILAYVMGAGVVIKNFSPSFGALISREQLLEGEYRQLHSRLRAHAESVAFYDGEKREEFHIQKKFKTLYEHIFLVLHNTWWFGIIQDFFLKYLGATVAVVLIIEPFFSGHLRPEASTLGRAEMLSNIRYHTSVIISLFQSLGTLSISSRKLNRLSGYADRIHELMVVSRDLSVAHVKEEFFGNKNHSYVSEANYIEFSGVQVVTPTGNVLVDNLTLKIESGSNLLITGPNGSGKSSLFRVLGGLWPLLSGHIVKPGVGSDLNKEIFYVPQRPYMAVGTLRDQLIYPLISDQGDLLSQDGVIELLKHVDLEYLLERYPPEKEVTWGDELSLGEQQRLGMARLFYHKPKFAILDECTSAVTTDMEERFCAKVRAMGTSCITISHRPALVAFHDVVLSLDGEGGWQVHHNASPMHKPINYISSGEDMSKPLETIRGSDAMAVQQAFVNRGKVSELPKVQDYEFDVISFSPVDINRPLVFPLIRAVPRALSLRAASMFKVLAPTLLNKQGVQLMVVALLVISRTWISDRIASLNGTTVKYVLEQNKPSFVRLVGISVLQSAASSVIAPSFRHLAATLALGWRIRLTQHLLKYYLRGNAFYQVLHMSNTVDADQRMTHDLEKLTSDLSGLLTGMVKPFVDILWFTWRMKMLTGQRGVAILYAYMLFGLGFLRTVTPDFGDLANREQELEGTFRFMHARLCAHAESIAFFGGGSREKAMIERRFEELLGHSAIHLKKKWVYDVVDDFVTKQLPHNVTWGLSLLYALEQKGDRALTSTQANLAHALRFLASVVSQSFLAFGDILELNRKFLELSGAINRVFEVEELLDAIHLGVNDAQQHSSGALDQSEDRISFSAVDIVTPSKKLLAGKLTCDVSPGNSLLVTGPNGSGKSSVFRVLSGLWPTVSGTLSKPNERGLGCGVFYVPQRPYTCLGTLRDQIIYPLSHEDARQKMLWGDDLDAHLRTILEGVRLVYLLQRDDRQFDAELNWEDTLSLGEQQRLGMARLFFHRPKFGILDECTNATSIDVEQHLYTIAKDLGITVVTSSQRPALIPFHSLELRLIDGEGKWELRTIRATRSPHYLN